MKSFGYLAMAVFLFYGAYRYVIQTRSIRQDFPEHFVSNVPLWATRALGWHSRLVASISPLQRSLNFKAAL